MRKIHALTLTLIGVLLGAASVSLALAADPPGPTLQRRAFMPAVAGDDASFSPGGGTPGGTATPTSVAGCAGLRTTVKTLSDGAAFSREPAAASVMGLLAAPRPDGITNETPRIAPFEARVVELSASLVGFRRTAGGGIDLIITQSEGGETMLASFPPLNCLGDTGSIDTGLVGAARSALLFACGNPPGSGMFKPLGGSATIRGVPFWGPPSNDQEKGAVTGIELGPVMGFEFDDATSCDADASKTPYPTKTPTPVLQEIRINVIPNPQVHRGQEIEVNVNTVPAILGRTCWWEMWDVNSAPVATGAQKQTGVDGWARWTFTIPEDMPLGQARVAPRCVDANTTGSARLDVLP